MYRHPVCDEMTQLNSYVLRRALRSVIPDNPDDMKLFATGQERGEVLVPQLDRSSRVHSGYTAGSAMPRWRIEGGTANKWEQIRGLDIVQRNEESLETRQCDVSQNEIVAMIFRVLSEAQGPYAGQNQDFFVEGIIAAEDFVEDVPYQIGASTQDVSNADSAAVESVHIDVGHHKVSRKGNPAIDIREMSSSL
ncbi:hypothetical protein B0H17DRAFT_1186372 [Mycena rosella]|uniref:Uncharacterized protein n=1 Tax=Mycena rosella TaxID=1033263 RepID=A0AAD7G2P9_MYCRO|nr:hypothetical protein B0H17DRAFT_1186372 [Mycena rosella]